MTPKTSGCALEALAGRVEALTGPDREVDAAICVALGVEPQAREMLQFPAYDHCVRYYTASLDAAMTLVPEEWNWMAGNRNQPRARAYVNNGEMAFVGVTLRQNPNRQWFEVTAATPALALCSAALRARARQATSAAIGGVE